MLSQGKRELPQGCLWYDSAEVRMLEKLNFIAWLRDQMEQRCVHIATKSQKNYICGGEGH